MCACRAGRVRRVASRVVGVGVRETRTASLLARRARGVDDAVVVSCVARQRAVVDIVVVGAHVWFTCECGVGAVRACARLVCRCGWS